MSPNLWFNSSISIKKIQKNKTKNVQEVKVIEIWNILIILIHVSLNERLLMKYGQKELHAE